MRIGILILLCFMAVRVAVAADGGSEKAYKAFKDVSYYDGLDRDAENFQTLDIFAPKDAVKAPVRRPWPSEPE